MRDRFRNAISQALQGQEQETASAATQKAPQIEEALYERCQGSENDYKEAVRSAIFNLKDKRNPLLRERVLGNEISPTEFANMSPEDMASPERQEEIRQARRKSINEVLTLGRSFTETDAPVDEIMDQISQRNDIADADDVISNRPIEGFEYPLTGTQGYMPLEIDSDGATMAGHRSEKLLWSGADADAQNGPFHMG
ncbi:Transcription elongation factor A protein 2 [Gaertneriomyces sp. JEL0708]|nr:Transcription elongation factor A protein 2 [Gaertneriomyces sp. JEL0708]